MSSRNFPLPVRTEQLGFICAAHRVKRLLAFGSALTGRFEPESSDLDFLVEFQPMTPAEHAHHYFNLMEELQTLFGLSIDLVEPTSIRNPYFREAVEENQLLLYAGA